MIHSYRLTVVAEKVYETPDICSFTLVDPEGGSLPPFTAGAHIDVHLDNGLTRPYSLCNDPREVHRYQLGVRLEPASRGGSSAMHRVEPGQTLRIGEPRNLFPLAEGAHHSILIAGGIGITPLLAMAQHLDARGASFELHYATRSANQTAFRARLLQAPFAHRIRFHHDDLRPDGKPDLLAMLDEGSRQSHVYVCGPPGFTHALMDHARAAGRPQELLHTESFGQRPPNAEANQEDRSFDVVIASTGQAIQVGARQSIVSALSAAGVSVPVSCEQGVCGTCVTRILEGIPDHRDMFLTPDEQAAGILFTPCCSRAQGKRLVLDL